MILAQWNRLCSSIPSFKYAKVCGLFMNRFWCDAVLKLAYRILAYGATALWYHGDKILPSIKRALNTNPKKGTKIGSHNFFFFFQLDGTQHEYSKRCHLRTFRPKWLRQDNPPSMHCRQTEPQIRRGHGVWGQARIKNLRCAWSSSRVHASRISTLQRIHASWDPQLFRTHLWNGWFYLTFFNVPLKSSCLDFVVLPTFTVFV